MRNQGRCGYRRCGAYSILPLTPYQRDDALNAIEFVLSKDLGNLLQFIKYGVSGCVATAVHVAIFHVIAWKVFFALQPQDWFVNLTAIYGSGLTNGNPNGSYVDGATGASAFGTGLFDFNTDAHVDPYVSFNVAAGHTFAFQGTTTLEPSIYIANIFDSNYLLKGAYFSGAAYGERRNVVFKLALHI